MRRVFNKLIRDKVPDIIKAEGVEVAIRYLDHPEMTRALENKLLEEAQEVCKAVYKAEILEELADVFEVIRALSVNHGSDIDEIRDIADKKKEEKGGFKRGIYLLSTDGD